jgi:hypothetical protein
VHGPVNLVRLMQVPDWVERPDLKFPPFTPACPLAGQAARHVRAIRKGDILLHHPFQSFQPVIDFIAGRRRPQRRRDQADRLPHRHRLRADEALIARRSAARKSPWWSS